MLEKLTLVDAEPRPETWPEIHEERQANRFAAALLMPEGPIRNMIAQGMDIGRMAWHCGVSIEAMEIRLKELRFLGKVTRRCR